MINLIENLLEIFFTFKDVRQKKEDKGKEKKEKTASVWKDWARFVENNENFHPYR